MKRYGSVAGLVALLALVPFSHSAAQFPVGRWQAHIAYDSVTIEFPLELSGHGGQPAVSFFNGAERVTSTRAHLSGDSLIAEFEHLATQLRAQLTNDELRGTYGNPRRRGARVIVAVPASVTFAPAGADMPDIDGLWYLPHRSSKGEHAWRFVVKQEGAHASATILRVDGDAGAHEGGYVDGRFVLNHFDGARASQLEVIPAADSVIVKQHTARATRTFVGLRPETARARGLPEPADFSTHTGVKDPDEPFFFAFPDLSGRLVSSTDDRFAGKVVIVNIGGSWCPNCHDEAPFLARLYRTYRERGLEIVALSFEDEDQLPDPQRLRAFIQRHGVQYTTLLAGQPDELNAKIPQAVNLNSWPTTFFLGRDGRVRAVHAGFAARASGAFHEKLAQDYTATIERLLAERQ